MVLCHSRGRDNPTGKISELFEKGTAIVVEQCPECRFVVVGDCKASMGGAMKKSVYKRFSLQQYVRRR